jgi:hypothetical protein
MDEARHRPRPDGSRTALRRPSGAIDPGSANYRGIGFANEQRQQRPSNKVAFIYKFLDYWFDECSELVVDADARQSAAVPGIGADRIDQAAIRHGDRAIAAIAEIDVKRFDLCSPMIGERIFDAAA